jgi:glycosyltransferase involved in cell wall biosynthesis
MGIEQSVFYPDDTGRESSAPLRIISTRRHEPLYDLDTLLGALECLAGEGLEFSAVLAGEGSRSGALREAARGKGLQRRTEFPGELSPYRLADALREADIYVSTSRSDSTSVSLLEAMACGAFPVVTDIPGNREWVSHGINGLLFPPRDSAALASCLTRAGHDIQMRSRAAEMNVGTIRKRAVWDDNMRRVEEAFLDLAGCQR